MSVLSLCKEGYQFVFPVEKSQCVAEPRVYLPKQSSTNAEFQYLPFTAQGGLFYLLSSVDSNLESGQITCSNKYLMWHHRLGFTPLETICQTIEHANGLDDFKHTRFQHNYISQDAKVGKTVNIDQPASFPGWHSL